MKASRSENAGRRYPPNPWEREPSRLAPPGGSAGSVLMVAAAPNRASRCPPRMPAVGRKPKACTGYMHEQGKGSGQPRAAHSHVSQHRASTRRPARLSQSVRKPRKIRPANALAAAARLPRVVDVGRAALPARATPGQSEERRVGKE